jgi:ElaB/YqjD/DUF883 family membrane-anchored ribosome-binding protein
MNADGAKQQSEELLKTTARNVSALGDQIQDTVNQGKVKLRELQDAVVDKTRYAAETTDAYVRDNPWSAIGVAAGIGLIIGLLLKRR